jgi:hypothetical protein
MGSARRLDYRAADTAFTSVSTLVATATVL